MRLVEQKPFPSRIRRVDDDHRCGCSGIETARSKTTDALGSFVECRDHASRMARRAIFRTALVLIGTAPARDAKRERRGLGRAPAPGLARGRAHLPPWKRPPPATRRHLRPGLHRQDPHRPGAAYRATDHRAGEAPTAGRLRLVAATATAASGRIASRRRSAPTAPGGTFCLPRSPAGTSRSARDAPLRVDSAMATTVGPTGRLLVFPIPRARRRVCLLQPLRRGPVEPGTHATGDPWRGLWRRCR